MKRLTILLDRSRNFGLRGVAHPNYQGKGFSKDLPTRLAEDFEEIVKDSRLIELREHMAAEDVRLKQLMRQLGQSNGQAVG